MRDETEGDGPTLGRGGGGVDEPPGPVQTVRVERDGLRAPCRGRVVGERTHSQRPTEGRRGGREWRWPEGGGTKGATREGFREGG